MKLQMLFSHSLLIQTLNFDNLTNFLFYKSIIVMKALRFSYNTLVSILFLENFTLKIMLFINNNILHRVTSLNWVYIKNVDACS